MRVRKRLLFDFPSEKDNTLANGDAVVLLPASVGDCTGAAYLHMQARAARARRWSPLSSPFTSTPRAGGVQDERHPVQLHLGLADRRAGQTDRQNRQKRVSPRNSH